MNKNYPYNIRSEDVRSLSDPEYGPEDVLTLPRSKEVRTLSCSEEVRILSCSEDVLTLLRSEDVPTLPCPEDVRSLSCSEDVLTLLRPKNSGEVRTPLCPEAGNIEDASTCKRISPTSHPTKEVSTSPSLNEPRLPCPEGVTPLRPSTWWFWRKVLRHGPRLTPLSPWV